MANFMKRVFGRGEPASSNVAKERLAVILLHDRSNLSVEELERLKQELLEVIARYVDFDPEKADIELSMDDRETRLRAEVPIEQMARRKRATISSQGASADMNY